MRHSIPARTRKINNLCKAIMANAKKYDEIWDSKGHTKRFDGLLQKEVNLLFQLTSAINPDDL